MQNTIILVNGTSSSGKSTLCQALQQRLDTPFWHFSSDHLIEAGMHPKTQFANGTYNWTEHRPLFFDAFHRSIASFSEAGINLIVEHIIEEPEWAHQLANFLASSDVFVVSAKCPLKELVRRKKMRGDRMAGEAEYHLKTYSYAPADIEVDTTKPADECCDEIIAAWRSRNRTGTFAAKWGSV